MAKNEAPQGPPTSESPAESQEQHETDWKAESRKWEARAKESLAAAKANESAAKRLAEIEDAQKTETQRQQEALAQAQNELAIERTARLRAEVAAAKGVPVSLISGSTQEEIEAAADALISWRGEQEPVVVEREYTIPAAGGRPDLALNGDGIESSLRQALGI